jgi:hypothetical protein
MVRKWKRSIEGVLCQNKQNETVRGQVIALFMTVKSWECGRGFKTKQHRRLSAEMTVKICTVMTWCAGEAISALPYVFIDSTVILNFRI